MTTTPDSVDALLPCPFCGDAPAHSIMEDESIWSHEVVPYGRVHCPQCEIGTEYVCQGWEPNEFQAWNRRAATQVAAGAQAPMAAEWATDALGNTYRLTESEWAGLDAAQQALGKIAQRKPLGFGIDHERAQTIADAARSAKLALDRFAPAYSTLTKAVPPGHAAALSAPQGAQPVDLSTLSDDALNLELHLRRGPKYQCQSPDCRALEDAPAKFDTCPSCGRKGFLGGGFKPVPKDNALYVAWVAQTRALYPDTAPPSQQGEAARQDFEKWQLCSQMRDLQELTFGAQDEYTNVNVRNEWHAWCAALESRATQQIPANFEWDPTRESIKSAADRLAGAQQAPAAVAAPDDLSDADLKVLWREAGGKFYGPNIETGSMPEAELLPFLRKWMGPNNYPTVVAAIAAQEGKP